MNEIKIFESSEFGQVRTVTVDGEPWFIGKDVCVLFGDSNHNRSLSRIDEYDKTFVEITDSLGRKQKVIAINESGLYALLFAMQPQKSHNKDGVSDEYPTEIQQRIEKLHRFKHWVTSVVLPSIRKNGGYIANQEDLSNEQILANAVLVAQNVIAEKDKLLKEKEECIIEMKPKVDYHDEVLNKPDLITMTIIAKDLGTTAAKLNQLMHDNRIIFKSGKSSTWCPYEEYKWLIADGYADYQSYKVDHSSPILKWTEKGRKWIIGNYELWLENI